MLNRRPVGNPVIGDALRIVIGATLLAACSGTTGPATTSAEPQVITSTTQPPTTTTAGPSTTTSPASTTTTVEAMFDITDLPAAGDCVIDEPPVGGEATVVADGRLYGLGGESAALRCLAANVDPADFEWGPQGDRVRVGSEVLGIGFANSVPRGPDSAFEWTAPTGSRLVVFDSQGSSKVDVADPDNRIDITFLQDTAEIAYHPAGTHLLEIGTSFDSQYGLWLATNQGSDQLRIAFDSEATLYDATWSWLGDPLFVAAHLDGHWHVHRVELTDDGSLDGPVIIETTERIDLLTPARHDPVMLAYRIGAETSAACVEGARAAVNGIDLPEPLASSTSTPLGWLSGERLLLMAYPGGCDSPAELWEFTAGMCPGSEYGATQIITGVDWAAARETAPPPPPSPDFTGIIDPAPA